LKYRFLPSTTNEHISPSDEKILTAMEPPRRLPPLNALRAFEAVARHLSMKRAADELHVTPAAISHQIKGLERHLGVTLFRRLNRALLLTDEGQLCLPGVREGFERLARAMDPLRARDRRSVLVASVAPSFATRWLVPRLDRLSAAHPDLELRITAEMALADFKHDEVDVGIRFGAGQYPGLHSIKLFGDAVVPMCSPRLMAGRTALKKPADLLRFTLLHDDTLTKDSAAPDWATWLKAAGVDDPNPHRGPHFNQTDHALQAAINGLGVVLGRRSLAEDDIGEGRLAAPFDLRLPLGFAYYLVCPELMADRPKVVAFRDWLLAELKQPRSGSAPPAPRRPAARRRSAARTKA
jgi:LysR family glycine cleavage system transcriptional activator